MKKLMFVTLLALATAPHLALAQTPVTVAQNQQAMLQDTDPVEARNKRLVYDFWRELPDPRTPGQTYSTTWFDMLRIVDGKIGEHWDYGAITAPAAPR